MTYSATCTQDDITSCSSNTVSVTTTAPPTFTISGNTSVIYGYGDNCTTMTAQPSGNGPFTYTWRQGGTPIGTNASQRVCPLQTTTYTVTVTDANGCTNMGEVTVTVQDVRCGNRNQNVTICYYGVTMCVSEKIAKNYLKLGATIGGCSTDNARLAAEETGQLPSGNASLQLSLKAYPNPVHDAVTVEVLAPTAGIIRLPGAGRDGPCQAVAPAGTCRGPERGEVHAGWLTSGYLSDPGCGCAGNAGHSQD